MTLRENWHYTIKCEGWGVGVEVDNKMGGGSYDFYVSGFSGNGYLYYFWNWCVFYKKERSKVNRILY